MGQSLAQAMLKATHSLRDAGVVEARQDAALLLAHILECNHAFLITHSEDPLSEEAEKTYFDFVKRRAGGEPLQHITGRQAFFNLEFEVNKDVLIPRPETELLVEVALDLLSTTEGAPFICDAGTGSGCISISLLDEMKSARAIAVDLSPAALCVAQRNARRLGVADRINFLASDCFAALKSTPAFSMIVSNPPYATETELPTLQREVRDHEPRLALVGGSDGLGVIRRLLLEAADYLFAGGYFLFEIGFDQHEAVRSLIDNSVWEVLDIHQDLQGIPRTVSLRKR
jgi:release factor glutamine methyltransferase